MCNVAFVCLPPSENLEWRLELRLSLPLIPEPFIMKCEHIKILSQYKYYIVLVMLKFSDFHKDY